MVIPPVPPVSLDALKALALNDGLGEGRLLKAKVEAMLSSTLARLNIEGQKVDLPTTRPLPVGATLTLKMEREDGQLRLVAQEPVGDAPDLPAGNAPDLPISARVAQRTIGNLTDPTRTILEKFQAVAVEAMLADADAAGAPWSQIAAPSGQPQARQGQTQELPPEKAGEQSSKPPEERPATGALDEALQQVRQRAATLSSRPTDAALAATLAEADAAETAAAQIARPGENPQAGSLAQAQPATETAARHSPRETARATAYIADSSAAPETRQHAAALRETLDSGQLRTGFEAAGSPARTERAAAFTVEVPLFFPGSATPLRLQVTRDEEPAAQDGEEPKTRSWSVRFDAEAGPLGMVHAAISLIDGHIGVQLLAERGDTADRFKQNAAQLRAALQASDLKLDAVSIAQGSPVRQELDVQ